MVIHFEEWFKAIENRRSRRTYVSKSIEPKIIESMQNVLVELNQRFDEVSIVFLEKSPDPIFSGAVGPYGKITGAPAYLAIVCDSITNFTYEKAGFIGQAAVLEAAKHGISSCWIAGYFDKKVAGQQVGISETEKIVAIIPIGYARKNLSLTEKMMSQVGDYQKRKSITEIAEGLPRENWPNWLEVVMNVANLSPTAYNRQSIRFIVGDDYSITLKIENPHEETNVPKGIDRGIAMLHIEVARMQAHIDGEWKFYQDANLIAFKRL